jgi:osmotically-inducible protein OsmY
MGLSAQSRGIVRAECGRSTWRDQPHQGKTKASAAQVSTKIGEALHRNAELDSRRIAVSATDSEVHLYGSVRSWFEREEAERAAWAVPGVTDVIDHISIVP